MNVAEVAAVRKCVDYLLEYLPKDATIGVATPFKAQQAELSRELRGEERVRVGTVHTFQGGERDALIFSLVAGVTMKAGAASWVNRQLNLWNVAITRARSHLIVVGDKDFWRQHGGTGAELLGAAEQKTASGTSSTADSPDSYVQHLYDLTAPFPEVKVGLSGALNGYTVDAVLEQDGAPPHPVLIDRGTATGSDPARHLRRAMRRRGLLDPIGNGSSAVRLPAWTLYDSPVALAELGIVDRSSSSEG